MSQRLGRQLIVDLFECDQARLDDPPFLQARCVAAAEAMGATVVAAHAHRFHPVGVSVVVVLSESHLAIHTWPERATASLDIFVCDDDTDPHIAKTHLARTLKAARTTELDVPRGNPENDLRPVHAATRPIEA